MTCCKYADEFPDATVAIATTPRNVYSIVILVQSSLRFVSAECVHYVRIVMLVAGKALRLVVTFVSMTCA